MGSGSSRGLIGGIVALICIVIAPIVFVTSLLGAASAADCAEGSTATTQIERGAAGDPIGLSALEIGRKIHAVGLETKHGEREILTAFAVALVESGGGVTMRNVPYGDADSVGVFQQRNIARWNRRNRMNVSEAALSFFEGLDGFDHGQPIGELAADIQRPAAAYRGRYAQVLPRARYFWEKVSGSDPASSEGLGSITAEGSSCGGSIGRPGRGKIGNDNDVVPPPDAPERIKRVIEAANEINHLPYVWGGGHGSWVDKRGYDCSGSVGYALHAGGFQSSPMVSGSYGSWGQRGPGRWITVYSNSQHVFMYVAGVRFDTSSYEAHSSGSGPRWRTTRRPHAGFVATHPPGF